MDKTTATIEAILFAGGEPVEIARLCEAAEVSADVLDKKIALLKDELQSTGSSLEVIKTGAAYQLCTRKDFIEPIRKAFEIKRNTPLSQAAFEVLAVVAYN